MSHHEPTDAELVVMTREGDSEAFAQLYLRHLPTLRAAARVAVRHGEVDDVVAEAFAATLGQIRRGGGPTTSVRAYLLAARRHVS
jgi:DNA-directed RNA polymerase specialized sigma24 family protein